MTVARLSPFDVRAIKRAATLLDFDAETIRRSCIGPDGAFSEPADRIAYEDRVAAAGALRSLLRRNSGERAR